jgi:hypothetical protein
MMIISVCGVEANDTFSRSDRALLVQTTSIVPGSFSTTVVADDDVPAWFGMIVHLGPRFALRPEFALNGAFRDILEGDSDMSLNVGIRADALWFTRAGSRLWAYAGPRAEMVVHMSEVKPAKIGEEVWRVLGGGLVGLQYMAGSRLGLLAETALLAGWQEHSTDDYTVTDYYFLPTWRASIGVLLYSKISWAAVR